MAPINERDWKRFRDLHPLLLQRFCEPILRDVARIASQADLKPIDRFSEIATLMHEKQKDCRDLFNDLRRSTALMQLAIFCQQRLVTDDELAQFSEEAQAAVRRIRGFRE